MTPKYGVLPEASAAPAAFNQALFQHLLDLFKDAGAEVGDAELQEVAFVMAAKLSPNTWASYSSSFSQFVRFCVARDTCFLPATKLTGLLWARELAARGTIKASTAHGRWHLH